MKLYRKMLLGLVFFAAALSACAPAAVSPPASVPAAALPSQTATVTEQPPIRLTDGLGTEITIPGPAKRIVSLGASNTEILFAIGADDLLAGADQFSDYPEAAKPLATISAGYGTLDVESISALEPDLVLAAEIISAEQVQSMRALGLTVFYVANPAPLPDGLYANIRAIGELTGRAAGAAALEESLRSRFEAVARRVAGAADLPLVFFELGADDPARPYTAGPGTFIDLLITLAGGRNLASALASEWPQISAEEIFRRDPDIILLGDAAFGATPESVAERPGWGTLTAVKNGRVFPIDSNLVLRPGPRLIDGLETMVSLFHPD
ncbi:MAG: ABC transporter substrate-binding protein [Anaerolineales bacterium]|nr:ABC transporter substrate-binding protein [Anaerolineales bacterium]